MSSRLLVVIAILTVLSSTLGKPHKKAKVKDEPVVPPFINDPHCEGRCAGGDINCKSTWTDLTTCSGVTCIKGEWNQESCEAKCPRGSECAAGTNPDCFACAEGFWTPLTIGLVATGVTILLAFSITLIVCCCHPKCWLYRRNEDQIWI